MLIGIKALKNHPDIVELKKLTTGVQLVRKNSSKSTTNICAFGSGSETVLLDKMRKFDTIAEINRDGVLMGTIHIIFMLYLIVISLLMLDTSIERYALEVKARVVKG